MMGISIASALIQGILNTETDKLSRLAMSGDYSLKQYFYLHGLRNLKVVPKFDLFTNRENMKCTRFCALCPKRKVGTEFMGNAMYLIWPSDRELLIHEEKELSLPPGNIAMYLLNNPARKTQNSCCAS
jgi:hypothetical protein